jgi:ABC-type phosphate transport system substrate-binding protein
MATSVSWPRSDKFIASPQNAGVAATIKQTPGTIGYIDYAMPSKPWSIDSWTGRFVG